MVAVVAGLLVIARPASPAVELPRVQIHSVTLSNGLRAFLVEDHQSPLVSVQVWYHVGSKNEVPGKTGFAHLFEHLMFQGTKNLPGEQFTNSIIRSGGADNAYTTEDSTVFWETFPNSQLPAVLWLEADRMRGLKITEQAFKTEREVVKEERRLKFDNPPYGAVVEALYAHAFTVHPYRHMPIGSMEDLDRADVPDLRAFYDKYYVPSNAVLVVVGDFASSEAEALISKYFSPLRGGRSSPERNIPAEPLQTQRRSVKLMCNVALPAFVEGYRMPPDGTPDAYPLRLAAKILSEGESSRIYRRLIYDKQIAVEAESSGNFTEDPNLFFVLAIMNSGHSPAEGEAEIEAELARLKTDLVPAAELDKAKSQILRDFILSRQTVESRAEELGYAAVVLKDADLVNAEPGRFLAVTQVDIRRVARKYFVPENMTVVEVFPQENRNTNAGRGNSGGL